MKTENRHEEIQKKIILAMAKLLPIDFSKQNQSISFIALHQMLLQYPREEFIDALKNIEGFTF